MSLNHSVLFEKQPLFLLGIFWFFYGLYTRALHLLEHIVIQRLMAMAMSLF